MEPALAPTTFVVRSASRRRAELHLVGRPPRIPPATVEVVGALDHHAARGFVFILREFVGDPSVQIDLSQCPEIDDDALDALASGIRDIRRAGGEAWVCGMSEAVERAVDAAGACDVLLAMATAASP